MAKQTFNLTVATLTAPAAVHYAFNPWYFDFTDITGVSVINLAGESREPLDGAVRFDIRRWVQTQFDGVVEAGLKALDYTQLFAGTCPTMLTVTPTVLLYNAAGTAINTGWSRTWRAVWGTLGRGESRYKKAESQRWFVNYPYTVESESIGDGSGDSIKDADTGQLLGSYSFSGEDWMVVNPAAIVKPSCRAVLISFSGVDEDYADIMNTITAEIDTTPLDAPNRVYLRWIDPIGRIRYFLFWQTAQTDAVSASSWNKGEIDDYETYDGYVNNAQLTNQSFTLTRTISLAARALSDDEYAVYSTVARSPIVDVFDGYDDGGNALWHRVNVVAGSYKRDPAHLQNFEFTITDRTQSTQEL